MPKPGAPCTGAMAIHWEKKDSTREENKLIKKKSIKVAQTTTACLTRIQKQYDAKDATGGVVKESIVNCAAKAPSASTDASKPCRTLQGLRTNGWRVMGRLCQEWDVETGQYIWRIWKEFQQQKRWIQRSYSSRDEWHEDTTKKTQSDPSQSSSCKSWK